MRLYKLQRLRKCLGNGLNLSKNLKGQGRDILDKGATGEQQTQDVKAQPPQTSRQRNENQMAHQLTQIPVFAFQLSHS